jgi:hypothetical protein
MGHMRLSIRVAMSTSHWRRVALMAALAYGSLAVGSVAYLIQDLSSPYSRIYRPSSDPPEQVLGYMTGGQETVGTQR